MCQAEVPDNQMGLETQNIDETMVDQTQAMEAAATQKLGDEEKLEKVNPSGSRGANQEAPADCRDLLIARLQAQIQAMEQGLNAPAQPPPKAPAAEPKAPMEQGLNAPVQPPPKALAAEPKAPMEQELNAPVQPPPKAPAAAPKAPMEQELNVPVQPPKAPAVPPKALSVQAPPAKAVPPASAESTLLYEAPPATEAPATQDLASAGIDLGAIVAAAKASPAIMGSQPLPAGAGTDVTTTSHRAEAMQLRRAMEAPDAEKTFPHMHKLFQGSKSVACLYLCFE